MQKIITILGLLLIVGVSIAITGCEIESASSHGVSITPSSVGIREGETVEFTASGGYEYTWSLDEASWGLLSDKTGSKTIYTSRHNPGTNTLAVRVLTVTSTIDGGSGTNAVLTKTAEAYIEHLAIVEAEEAAPEAVYISPSEVTLTNTQSQTFTAYGGDGEYSWSLKEEKYGWLSTRIGRQTTYTSLYAPGTNVVYAQELTVTSGGTNFTAYIKHQ